MPISDSIPPKKGLKQDILKISSGSALSQLIVFLAAPLISRLYDPAHYGSAAVLLSLITVLSTVATLRFNNAIVLPLRDHKAKCIFSLCLFCTCCVSIFFFLLALCLPQQVFLSISVAPELMPFVWLVPVAIFFNGVNETIVAWATREKKFGRYALANIVSSTSSVSCRIGGGFWIGSSTLVLVVSRIIACAVNSCVIWAGLRGKDSWISLDSKKIRELFDEYKDFPLYSASTGLLNTFGKQLPIICLGGMFTPEVVGFYALATTIIQQPIVFIGNAVRKVFFQRSAALLAEGQVGVLRRQFGGLNKKMALGALPPFLLLFFYSDSLIPFVLGDKWLHSGRYVQYLSPWLYVWFLTPASMAMLVALRKQAFLFYFQNILLACRALSLIVGGLVFSSADVSIILFSLVSSSCQLFLIFYAVLAINNEEKK